MDPLLAALAGGFMALLPALVALYFGAQIDYIRGAGLIVSFVAGFTLGVLAQLWSLFHLRFTYLLSLFLLALSIGFSWWGMYKRWWPAYVFAAAAWLYLTALLGLAKLLGLPDPFIF